MFRFFHVLTAFSLLIFFSLFLFVQKIRELADLSDQLSRPIKKFSLVSIYLAQLDHVLETSAIKSEWKGAVPANGVLSVDICFEFYRLWSAIQWSYSTPPMNTSEYTPR
jgi:hypothetical protein